MRSGPSDGDRHGRARVLALPLPVRQDPVLTTAEIPFRFTQNVDTDVNLG